MWFIKRSGWSICGLAVLVALAGPGNAEEAPTVEGVEGAANTFAGVLAKPDARACLPGGGLSLLGVKYADTGMRGFSRLRNDNPLRIKQRESYDEVQKQSGALAPVADKVRGLNRDVASLQENIPNTRKSIEQLQDRLARDEAGPGAGAEETAEQKKNRAEGIARLKAEIQEASGKLAQMQGKLAEAERELGPVRLEEARLYKAYMAARTTNNADWKAANDTGNSCP